MFDQLLSGKRQSGKTAWLVAQALDKARNREETTRIVVVGHDRNATNVLRARIDRAVGPGVKVKVHTIDSLARDLKGWSVIVDNVIILVDEVQLHRNSVADKIERIMDEMRAHTTTSPHTYVYGTHAIGEHV
jgi:thymidine kinase